MTLYAVYLTDVITIDSVAAALVKKINFLVVTIKQYYFRMDGIGNSNRLGIDILNQNGISHSNDTGTQQINNHNININVNNNNNNNKVRTKRKVIRKPNILALSSFDAFHYRENIFDKQQSNNINAMDILPLSKATTDSNNNMNEKEDDFDSVIVKFSDKTDKRYKMMQRKATRREKIEELRNNSIKKCGANVDENALYTNMLESYEQVLGNDIYEDFKPANDDSMDPCIMCNLKIRSLNEREKEAFMRRDLVLTELIDTERNYLVDLEFIVNRFLPLMTEDNITDDCFKSYQNIFMNIDEIYQFHFEHFHSKIEECFENPDLLNDTFYQYENELTELYTFYCSQKPFADEVLKLHESELDALCKLKFPDIKLNMKDYLIKPVQRLMKYQLLLSSIKKYGVKAGKEPTYLDISIQVMERVPKEANDAMHVGLITGYNSLGSNVQQLRQLMTHSELEVSVGKAKPKTMHLFLFENILLFTEKAEKLVPEYKCIDTQDTGRLGYTDSNNTKFVIWFRKHNKTDIYICEAKTMEEKETWKEMLGNCLGLKEMHLRKRSCRRQLTIEITPTCPERASSYEREESLRIEEAVIRAMEGHPRMGIMTEKLKSNIEKYIAREFIIPNMESNGRHNFARAKTNPNITVPSRSLTSGSDMRRDSNTNGRKTPPSPSNLFKYTKRFNLSPNPKKKDGKKSGEKKLSVRTKSIY